MLVIDNFITFLMPHAASTLAQEKSSQCSVKYIGGISLKLLIKHRTILEHGTPKFVSQLQLQK